MALQVEQLESREVPSAYRLIAVSDTLPGTPEVRAMYLIGSPPHSGEAHVVTPQGGPWTQIVVRV